MSKYKTSNKTQQALITATGELAAADGFSAITTRSIADRSGENIGSIHYHFGGKDKLFEAVLLTACQPWLDNPLEDVLVGCDLQKAEGQAESVRRVIIRVANLLFDKENPCWFCRVVYRVMKTDNNLRDIFISKVMDREHEQVGKILNAIDSSLSEEIHFQHFFLLFAPLYFHADYQGAILQRLEKSEYSQEYLDTLVNNCIKQTLMRYGLPLE